MPTDLVKQTDATAIEKVILGGDLKDLRPEERLAYYNRVCESLGLNPLTQPFAYLSLSNKLTLYARKDAAEQLRKVNGISLKIISREVVDDMYIVTAHANTPQGRIDESTGVISIKGLAGEAKANAMMKAETKSKRRVTLSICGLGLLDETEADSVPGARKFSVEDAHSGRLIESAPEPQKAGNGGVAGNAAPSTEGPFPRPIPEELKDAIGKLRAGDRSVIDTATKFVEEEMLVFGLGKAFANRKDGLRASFPKGTRVPGQALETFFLDCWEEIEKAKAATAAPPADPKADWLPEGLGE